MTSLLRASWWTTLGLLLTCSVAAQDPSYAFNHFAGSQANPGALDGTGTAAQFSQPHGVALDGNGNIYVADFGNRTIRKITAARVVTTFAGVAGESGSTDGAATAARFVSPTGVATDGAGFVYVADASNHTIRKISPAGVVSTLAGLALEPGSADGTTAARFNYPWSVAVDSVGNVFVADRFNNTIRKITPVGVVSTFAGTAGQTGSTDGTGPAALFNDPSGVAVDDQDNVYVADSWNQTIRKITPAGVVTTLAGKVGQFGHVDGVGVAAVLDYPAALAVDGNGTVFVAETGNVLRKITASGVVTTVAGLHATSGDADGIGSDVRFSFMKGIAVDGSGSLYVGDYNNHSVRKGSVPKINSWDQSGPIVYGTALSATQLNAVANVDGTFTYSPPIGTKLEAGAHPLTVSFAVANAPTFPPLTANVTLTVSKAPLTASAVNASKVQGAANPTLTISYSGFVNGDTAAVLDTPPSVSTTATASSPVGSYPIVLSGGTDNNYAFTLQDGVFSISIATVAPSFTLQPTNQTAATGAVVNFSAQATGTPAPTLRWQSSTNGGGSWSDLSEGAPYSGVGTATLRVENVSASMNAWRYRTIATNSVGSETSSVAELTVTTSVTPPPLPPIVSPPASLARLVNISARGYCSTGDRVMIGGFVIGGSEAKRILVRAVGPTLLNQGIGQSEVLLDPQIEVHRGAPTIASNDNWGDNANAAEIITTAARIGATAFDGGDTKSSALLLTLEPGVYTFVASGKAGTSGIVLLEVYDADPATGASFANISTRAYSTTGNGVTIGGFVVAGTAAKQVMLRAVGPSLTQHNVSSNVVLGDPTITLYHASRGNATIGINDDWGDNLNAAAILTSAARIGAMPLHATDSKSSALLVTLQPGVYTFSASGKSGGSGIVLVEVYDAD